MKKLLLTLSVIFQALVMSAQLRVEVPDVVSLDEQFNVTFVYEGENTPSGFEWSQGDDFQLVWGPQQGRSTSIQIINGKRTKSSQFTYTYILTPKNTGTFTIPAGTITVKGKTWSTSPVNVTVVAEGASAQSRPQSSSQSGQSSGNISEDNLFLSLTFSKRNVVVGEPIVATLKLYQRVNIAGFEDARFPSFNGFWNQEIEAPTNIEFHRESRDNKIYNAAVIRKYILIPQQSGTLTVDPAELVCLVNIRTVSSGSVSIFDEFFDEYRTVRKRITTPSYKIQVSPLPAGAPASFKGGVGEFSISAELSKDSLRTHDAASLIVTIKGRGNVSLLEEPDVVFPPDFEVYDTKVSESVDKASGMSGSKTYEFPFIPRSAGDFAIAPVKYSYYDINAGKYVTIETPLIPFSVAKGSESEVSGAAVMPGVTQRGVRNLNQDIRFIDTKNHRLSPKGDFFTGSFLFWGIAGLIIILGAAGYFLLRILAARRADVVGSKNRGATKMARKRLHRASEFLSGNLYSAFYDELHKALVGYVSDKLNMSVADYSKDKVSEALAGKGVPAKVTGKFVAILDACEFARYSPDQGTNAMSAHYQDAVEVISSIDSYMKNNKNSTTLKVVTAMIFLSIPLSGFAADGYVDSLFNAASAAYSEGNWTEAADTYSSIENLGLESPSLYCNMGNAWFKSGDVAKAMLYYEKALKLDPSYDDARYNRTVISDFIQDRIEPVPEFILKTWTRDLCYILDSDTWAVTGLVFLGLVVAALLLLFLSSSLALRRTGFFTAIVAFLLMVMSFAFAFWQKNDYMRKDGAIIMTPVVSVKSSPSSETSTDLFILHEGTKVLILDEVGDWRNIELADGRQGWMKSSDMEII